MAYVGYKTKDNAWGQLNASLTSGATTFNLNSGDGARFPSLGVGEKFIATLVQFDGSGFEETNVVKRERITVTARSSDNFTVTRGFDGDTPTTFNQDDYVFCNITSVLIEELQDEVVRLEADKLDASGALRTGLTAWRTLYNNGSGVETELAIGSSGQVLTSNGATSAPSWQAPPLDINSQTEDNTTVTSSDYMAWRDAVNGVRKRIITPNTTREGIWRKATSGEGSAGSAVDAVMTPDMIKDNYLMVPGTDHFTVVESATPPSDTVLAHGLGKNPKLIVFYFYTRPGNTYEHFGLGRSYLGMATWTASKTVMYTSTGGTNTNANFSETTSTIYKVYDNDNDYFQMDVSVDATNITVSYSASGTPDNLRTWQVVCWYIA